MGTPQPQALMAQHGPLAQMGTPYHAHLAKHGPLALLGTHQPQALMAQHGPLAQMGTPHHAHLAKHGPLGDTQPRALMGSDLFWPIRFGPIHFWANPFWANPFWANPFWAKFSVCGPEEWGLRRVGAPKGGGQKGGEAQNFALFSLSRSIFALFVSLWVSSRGFLVVSGSAGAVKCVRLEFSGCRVKPRRPQSRRGFTRQPRAQTRIFEGPGLHKPTKFNDKTPRERETKRAKVGWERGKKERNFGRSGGGRSGRGRSGRGGSGRGRVSGGGSGGRREERTKQNTQHTQQTIPKHEKTI